MLFSPFLRFLDIAYNIIKGNTSYGYLQYNGTMKNKEEEAIRETFAKASKRTILLIESRKIDRA